MKILVTGGNGQLGNELRDLCGTVGCDIEFVYTDIDELDITSESEVEDFVSKHSFDAIINCAAYTAVDKAEDHVDNARRVNVDAVGNLGRVAHKYGMKMIHVSTDYVFDGRAYVPYKEDDMTNPIGVYAKTKFEGEELLFAVNNEAIVVRTSWLYSTYGNNFVKTMIKLGNDRDVLTVIYDQIGTPTYASDLAKAISKIITGEKWVSGVYHFSNEGVCSWYDFAKEIHEIAGIECNVKPIETFEYPVKTPRPHYSVLNKRKIKETYGVDVPHWKDALKRCISKLNNQ